MSQRPLGNTAELKLAISPQLDAGLDQLAELTGVSRATAVRYSIVLSLSLVGLLNPEVQDLVPTRTKTKKDKS